MENRDLVCALSLLMLLGCSPTDSPPEGQDPTPDMAAAPQTKAPSFVPGAADRLLLVGKVVAPDQVFDPGEVLIVADRIRCVAEICAGQDEAKGATVLHTEGLIYPGLIDAHNHTQYNYLPPWKADKLFSNRGQWAARADYKEHTKSVNANEGTYACQQVKYGELRALVGGTTTIQGSGSSNRRCYRTLVHNAEYGNELGPDRMRTDIIGISGVDETEAMNIAKEMKDGTTTAYVIHLAEGIDETSRKEFDQLEQKGLLSSATVLIHGTALGMPELQKLGQAGGKLVWSPLSNLNLYGKTTNIPMALSAGVKVALAPDWTLSGSVSLLGELKVAKKALLDQGMQASARDLFRMVTENAADVLGLKEAVGRLAPGLLGDVLVLRQGPIANPYEALIAAQLADVELVLVGGRLRYGDPLLMDAVAQKGCEAFMMCGKAQRICVPDGDDPKDGFNEDLAAVQTALRTFYPSPYPIEVCN